MMGNKNSKLQKCSIDSTQCNSENKLKTELGEDSYSKSWSYKSSDSISMQKSNNNYEYKQRLIAYGYIRNIRSDENKYNYDDIIFIIISYYVQGFAKYFAVEDESINYKEQMRFGDILKTKSDEYMVLNMDNELEYVGEDDTDEDGDFDIDIKIPSSICKYLVNTPSFYSKYDQIKGYSDAFSLTIKLCVENDDECIVKNLGAALDSKYKSVVIILVDPGFIRFKIGITEENAVPFNPFKNKISCDDIDKFFEIRKNDKNLVKIRVVWNEGGMIFSTRCRTVVSILWSIQINYSINNRFVDYVGPNMEKDVMMDHLQTFYQENNEDVNISIIQKDDRDVNHFLSSYVDVDVLQ